MDKNTIIHQLIEEELHYQRRQVEHCERIIAESPQYRYLWQSSLDDAKSRVKRLEDRLVKEGTLELAG